MKISLRFLCALAVLLGLSIVQTAHAQTSEKYFANPKMKNQLACRVANYGEYQEEAFAHMAECGFKYVFMNIIQPEEIEKTQKELDRYGLEVAVFRGDTDLSRESSVDELAEQLATCEKMGVGYLFLSPKHKTVSKEVAIERLKRVGPIARKHGVVVGLETHPDLGTNAEEHLKTMRAIDHPNLRVNFDTANVTYYNKNTDATAELKKCIDYVAMFEVKDHSCEFEGWHFPALGRGKVNIPALVCLLKEHDYDGPITIEIEGTKGVERSKEEIKWEIEESYRYMQSLGEFD